MRASFYGIVKAFIGAPHYLIARILAVALAVTAPATAQEKVSHATVNEGKPTHEVEDKFNPGEMILHHIADAHDWHFATMGGKHITIYLPVIAYSSVDGLQVFSASRLHHAGEADHDATSIHAANGNEVEGLGANHEPAETEANAGTSAHGDSPTVYAGYYLDEHEHLQRVDKASFFDLSVTKNVASMFISVAVLFGVFFSVSAAYKRNPTGKPSGLQSLMEPIFIFIRDEIARPNIGEKRYLRYLPYLMTVFFFIWFNNLLGLLPGGANLTGNIAVTMTLAVLTFIITLFSANKAYWEHIYNTPGVPWWLKFPIPLMPAVEFIGMFTKPFSLMIRLFANITAGHIIILSLLSLIFIFESYVVGVVSAVFVVAMTMMELLVALIQAYVFTLLTAMYFGGAVAEHNHEHDHSHAEHGADHANEYEHEFGHDEHAKANIAVAPAAH